ncbi:MAG: DUF5343 domain-containing protein [Erythrobacter sp.]
MASLPYITSTGNVDKALNAIKKAAVPDRVSQDFVKTILQIPGGSGDQVTTYLKKIDFASSDGTPTELYKKFRNPSTSGIAVAQAIRHAYAPLFVRNEFMYQLSDDDLLGLIVEETGLAHDANPVKLAFACIKALKKHADFDAIKEPEAQVIEDQLPTNVIDIPDGIKVPKPTERDGSIGLNLGYTINLNLPPTTDQAVFNAIFKSLKTHLLSSDDA